MTCFYCREVREHTYCAKIYLKSPPDMWLCEVCRSSARVLHIPSLVDKDVEDLTTDHGASSSEISSDRSKKHKPPYLAFPSPKRKPRTPRVPVDPEEAHDPCVFRRID
ncbi:zinc ion binding [Raphanus sativus]|nr:zinc ion binding [Raphanus sativus]